MLFYNVIDILRMPNSIIHINPTLFSQKLKLPLNYEVKVGRYDRILKNS